MKSLQPLAMAAILISIPSLALAAEGDAPKPAKDGWIPLFNGKDLTGWKVPSTAIFKVEDGCLMGTQTDGKGGDLYTTAAYDNFEIRFTYKIGWPANSGVWFRDGYQFDILKWKNPVAFSGTLYCPGKMFITKNLNEAQENRDGWNEGLIYANGDRLVLWLNGKRVGDCRDTKHAKGKVGIQVHGGDGFKNMTIHLRRIELRPLKADDQPADPKPDPTTMPAAKEAKKADKAPAAK